MNIKKEEGFTLAAGVVHSCFITQCSSKAGVQVQSAFSLYTCEFDLSNPLEEFILVQEPEDLHTKCQEIQAIQGGR